MKNYSSPICTLLLFSTLFAFGCGGSSGGGEARLRVFHASPDAPNVDVIVDGGRVLENVPYPAASEFLPLDAGHRQISVAVAGTDTLVIDTRADLADDTSYLVIASGKVANIAPLIAVVESDPVPENSAKIRVLHTAPSAPNVDIYVVPTGSSLDTASPALENVPFGGISDYLTVPANSYDLYVTVASTKTVAIEAKGVNVTPGLRASIAALDATGAGAPFSLKILDESQE